MAAVFVQLVATIGAGFFAEAFGLRNAAFLAPLGALVAAVSLWLSPARRLRDLPVKPLHGVPPLEALVETSRNEPVGG